MARLLEKPQIHRHNNPKRNKFRYLLPSLALSIGVAVVGSYFAIKSTVNPEKEEHYVMDAQNSPIANEKLRKILTKQLKAARTEFIDLTSMEPDAGVDVEAQTTKQSLEQVSATEKTLTKQIEHLRETNFKLGKRKVGVGTSTYQFLVDYDIYSGYGIVSAILEEGVLMEITAGDDSESHEVLIPYGTAFYLSLVIDEESTRGYLMLPMKFKRTEESDHVLVIPSCATYATLSVTGAERITWKYPSCSQ